MWVIVGVSVSAVAACGAPSNAECDRLTREAAIVEARHRTSNDNDQTDIELSELQRRYDEAGCD